MSKTISSSSVQDIVHAFELTGHSVYYNMEESNDKETYTVRNNETDKIVMSIEKLVGSPLAHLIDLVNCDPYRITYHEVEKEEVMWQLLNNGWEYLCCPCRRKTYDESGCTCSQVNPVRIYSTVEENVNVY